VRLAALLIILGIALIAFGILNPNFGKTLYPAGTQFSFDRATGPSLSVITIYAGAAITALGALLVAVRLVRR
jgi:hypothetical protein